MIFRAKKKVIILLLIFNMILLGISWIMAAYAFPRLPPRMPLWVNLFGQQPISMDKSFMYFIYPAAQTLLFFVISGIIWIRLWREKESSLTGVISREKEGRLVQDLQKEFVFLVLIFFQLIFIHLQRSIILMAHGVEKGIRPYYFYSIFGIILILIPYYRIRLRTLRREWAGKK